MVGTRIYCNIYSVRTPRCCSVRGKITLCSDLKGKRQSEGIVGRRRVKGGDSINASRGAPLARCTPCSVCISTVGMIVGAEAGHCPSWIVLSFEREMDGREEKKKAGTKRGSGSEDDP